MRKFLVLALVPLFFAATACNKSEETPAAPEASAAASTAPESGGMASPAASEAGGMASPAEAGSPSPAAP
jgi:hypothetical protein